MLLNLLFSLNKKRIWRKRNRHNDTFMVNIFNIDNVHVGNYTYGGLNVLTFDNEKQLKIGHCCSIAPGVVFVLSAEHYLNHISSFPFKVKVLQTEQYEAISKGNIIVEDDVWIGQNAIILSGVRIGQGAVIAAGAVVNKDVEPYTIVGGVPAKTINRRFSENIIEELLNVDYSKLNKDLIEEHIHELYVKLENAEQLAWMPKKQRKMV